MTIIVRKGNQSVLQLCWLSSLNCKVSLNASLKFLWTFVDNESYKIWGVFFSSIQMHWNIFHFMAVENKRHELNEEERNNWLKEKGEISLFPLEINRRKCSLIMMLSDEIRVKYGRVEKKEKEEREVFLSTPSHWSNFFAKKRYYLNLNFKILLNDSFAFLLKEIGLFYLSHNRMLREKTSLPLKIDIFLWIVNSHYHNHLFLKEIK